MVITNVSRPANQAPPCSLERVLQDNKCAIDDLRNMLPAEGSMLGPEYLDAYHDIIPITPPEEDYVDRLTLYAM